MKILLVEDDPLQCMILTDYLKKAGHSVDSAANRTRADEYMNSRHYDVAAVDLVLMVSTGDTVAERAYHKGMAVIIMSAATEEQLQAVKETIELKGAKVHKTLKKPFTPKILELVIEEACRAKALEKKDEPQRPPAEPDIPDDGPV